MNRFLCCVYLQPQPHFEELLFAVVLEQAVPFAAVGVAGGEKISKGKSMLSKKSHTV